MLARGTCRGAHRRLCTYTNTHGSTSKDACGSACTDDCGNVCTYISTESIVVHGIMCPYVSNKGMGMHRVMSTDNYMVKTVVYVRTNTCDEYRRYKSKRDIGKGVLGKVIKRIIHAYALH